MEHIEKLVVEILSNANGYMATADLMREFKRRLGVDGSRTRGVVRTLEKALLSLQSLKLVSASKQIMPAKRHSHCSTVGRDVKPVKHKGCCTPSPAEKAKAAEVKNYNCAFFSLTDQAKKTLHT